MTQISSEPAHNAATLNDEVTLALRAITEKRAATIGYLLDESRQRHIADDFAREAIRHYGRDIGHKLRAQMRDRQDLQEFAGLFTRGLESQVYEMVMRSAINEGQKARYLESKNVSIYESELQKKHPF